MKAYRLFAILLVVLCFCAVFAQAADYYRCSGKNILDPAGAPFLIKGNALSHWNNTEAYALKLNAVHSRHLGSESSIKTRIREIIGETNALQFWSTYRANLVTASDIASFKAEGFNTIRLPFNYRLLSPEATPGVYSEEGFAALNQIIQWCKTNGLAVILDMHACPGGQSHDAPADPEHTFWAWEPGITNWLEYGVACLWVSNADYFAETGRTPEFNKQRMADIWREIATRYASETAIIGYELINEPVLPAGVTSNDLRALLLQVTAAIRAVDTNHILFVEGDEYAYSIAGLVPPWDSNMALCFHKYWQPANLAGIQQYLDAANQYNIPLCMTESGENSSPWFYELKTLLQSNNIGWFWWGYKKVDLISSAFSALVTPDYQYVINNFRDLPIDAARAKKGLMECATNMATIRCSFDPGWYDALLGTQFSSQPYAFVSHALPCKIYCVNYDVGNQGVAYSDVRYKNEDGLYGAAYNSGYQYRNDGVDIGKTIEGNGFKVSWIDNNEWLKFSISVSSAGKYDITLRTASPNSTGRFQLYLDGTALTSVISIPRSGGWETWKSTTVKGISLSSGNHSLQARFPVGGFDISSIEFKKATR
jgi:endoglucanase